MRYSLDEIDTFLTVMDLGTVTAAAARLNLSKSVVSRRITEFETTLGAALFRRHAGRIVPTETALRLAERHLDELHNRPHDRVGAGGNRTSVGVRQQCDGRFGRVDAVGDPGVLVQRRGHVLGVESAGGRQRTHASAGRGIFGQLLQSGDRACGHDLAHSVAVGRHEVECFQPCEHLGFVTAEDGPGRRRFSRIKARM